MANLFQPKRVFVPGLLSDEGLAAQVKELTSAQKATAESAPPNTSAVEFADQVTTMQAGKLGKVVDQKARLAAQDAKSDKIGSDIAGAASTIPGVKEVSQIGVLSEEQAAKEKAARIKSAQEEVDYLRDLNKAIETGVVPTSTIPGSDQEKLQYAVDQAAGRRRSLIEAEEELTRLSTGPDLKYEWWRNAAEVAARSAVMVGVDTLKYPVSVWDLSAETITGEKNRSEIGIYLDGVDKALTKMLPGDPGRAKDFVTDLASGAGSMTGFMIGGFASRAVGLPAAVVSGVLGAAVTGNAQYEDAQNFDASTTEKWIALIAGSALGATEAIPIDRAFFRADQATGGLVRQMLANTAATSIEEFSQELAQAVGEDLIAKYTYDEGRDLNAASWLKQATVGAIVGGGSGAVISIIEQGGERREVDVANTDTTKMTAAAEEAINVAQQDFDTALGDEAADLPGLGGAVEQPAADGGGAPGPAAAAPAAEAQAEVARPAVAGDAVRQIVEKAKPVKVEAPAGGETAQPDGVITYKDGGTAGISLRAVKRADGSFASERTITADDGTVTVEHLADGFQWRKGPAPVTVVTGFTSQTADAFSDATAAVAMARDMSPGSIALAADGTQSVVLDPAVPAEQQVSVQVAPAVETPEFKAWFGDSVVRERAVSSRDNTPKAPLRVYHGTQADFTAFNARGTGTTTFMGIPVKVFRSGIFFAEDKSFAESFAAQGGRKGRVIEAYLSIQNPLDLSNGQASAEDVQKLIDAGVDERWARDWLGDPKTTWEAFESADSAEDADFFVNAVKAAGFDGVRMTEIDPDEQEGDGTRDVWVAFEPTQIKSATANDGSFDADDPNIDSQVGTPINPDIVAQVDAIQLEPHQISPLPDIEKGLTGPIPRVVQAAKAYANAIGLPHRRARSYVKVDTARAARIAEAYTAMKHEPNDPAVQAAYRALAEETLAQYQYVRASGIKIEAIVPWQPAPLSAKAQALDVTVTRAPSEIGKGYGDYVTYTEPSGGVVRVVERENAARAVSVVDFVVPEALRGQGIGRALMERVLADNPSLMGQVSSRAAAKLAYDMGRRPFNQPDATLEDIYRIIESDSSVNLLTPGLPDPYPNGPRDVLKDINAGHIWYFPTDQGFGSSDFDPAGNPLLEATDEVSDNGQPMVVNDLFRVVHDFFGHGLEGTGFGPRGEENAWQSHMRLFTASAVPAMTSETRGQNSWVNYGPFGEQNRKDPRNTVYADQKTGLMPSWTWTEGVVDSKADDVDAPVGIEFMHGTVGKKAMINSTYATGFRNYISEAAAASPFGAAVHVYSVEEYKKMKLFVAPDALSGFALDGDTIVSVFSHPQAGGGRLPTIIDVAVANGGRKLDAFDGKLVQMYAALGFKETGRVPFDPAQAPEGWKAEWGTPDVVFMEYVGDAEQGLASLGTESPAFLEWDGGAAIRDDDGVPLVLYSGAPKSLRKATREMWLTPDRRTAEQFAQSGKEEAEFDEDGNNIGGSVFTFYARMENPVEIDWQGNMWSEGPDTEYPTVYRFDGESYESYGDAEQAVSDLQDKVRKDAEQEVRDDFANRMYVAPIEDAGGPDLFGTRFEVRRKSDNGQLLDMLRDSLAKNESALARTIAYRDTAVRMLAEGTAANDVQAVLDDYNNRTIPVLTQAVTRDRASIAAREAVGDAFEVIGIFDTEAEARDFENTYTEEKATEAGDAAADEVDTDISEETDYDSDGAGQTTDSVVESAKYGGHDGVIFRDVDEGYGPVDVYVVIEPGNAKSTANIGTYNREDPDILRMTGTATQRQPYALEPTRPTRGVAARPAEPPNDVRLTKIADNLSKLLNLTVRHGRLVGNNSEVMGQFNRRTGVIRLRTWTDLSTLAHEAGHAINDQMAQPLDALVSANLAEFNKIAKIYQGDLSQATGATKRREGFAEFFRVYAMTPDYARNTWAQLTTDFEALLDREDPQLKTGLNAIAAQVKAWQQLPSGRLIENTIIDGRREQGLGPAMKELRDLGFKSWMQEMVRRNIQWSTNRYAALNRLTTDLLNEGERNRGAPIELERADDPRVLARLARNSGSRGMIEVTDGVIGYKGTQSMSKGLREAIMVSQGVNPNTTPAALDEERLHTFSAYLVARRALEEFRRYDAGEIDRQPVAFSKGDAAQAVREWEKQYPNFVKAADIVHGYGMALWQKSYDAGLISKETYEDNLSRQFYVPLQRDMSDKRETLGDSALTTRGSGPLRSIVKRFRGSDRDIIDPLSILMQKTFALEQLISENDAKKALAVLSDRVGAAGALVERIPASQLIGQEFGVREVARQLTGLEDMADTDAADLMTILGASIKGGDTISLFRSQQASAKGEPVLFFWENGKVAAIQVKDGDIGVDVVNTLNAVGRENMDKWLEGVAATSTVFRTAITSWPDFLFVNFIRDQMSAWILNDVGFVPFVSGIRGVADEVRQKGWAKLYNYGQGIMGGMNVAVQHTAHVDRDIRSLRAKGYIANVFGDVRSGWDFTNAVKGLARLSAVTETGTRLGLFKGAFNRAKREGLDDYQSTIEAAYTATDYIDFGLNGNRMMTSRRLIPFLNAQIQGFYKMVRTLGGDEVAQRKGHAFVLGAYFKNINNLPLSRLEKQQLRTGRKAWLKMLSLGLISAALHYLWKDDEDYQEAGEYLRTTGWVIPTGNGQVFHIPKPFELAMIANAVERALEAASGDGSAIDRFLRGVAFNLTPPTTPPLFSMFFEVPNNIDTFTGRPIVPDHMRALAPELQYDNYTSSIAKWMGDQFNWSPMVIDHVLGGFGASAYRDLATMTNLADPTRPSMATTDAPILRRFVRDVRRGSVSAQDFWSQASSTNGKLAQSAASYKYEVDAGNEPAANRRLAAMTADQRSFAVLMTHFKAEEKRLNPFYRATQVTTLISKMRRETSSALSLGDTTVKDSLDTIPLTAGKKREVDTILSEIARREVRNTMIATGQPGWKGKEILPVEPTIDLLLSVAPDVYDEFQRRWKKAKVYDAQTVYDYWPDVRDRLVQDGPDAILSDAVAVASAGL